MTRQEAKAMTLTTNREAYVLKTIAAAAHLLGGCESSQLIGFVMGRVSDMLCSAWTIEYRTLKRDIPNEHLQLAVRGFWDKISFGACCTVDRHLYRFEAVYDETVNPPGQEGNVYIRFQPNNSAHLFAVQLSLTP